MRRCRPRAGAGAAWAGGTGLTICCAWLGCAVAGADRPEAAPVLWSGVLSARGRLSSRRPSCSPSAAGGVGGQVTGLRQSGGSPVVAEGAVARHSVTGAAVRLRSGAPVVTGHAGSRWLTISGGR
jgi:hypothetical protein